jgi:uncharacterized protein
MSANFLEEHQKTHRAIAFTLYLAGGVLIFLFGANTYDLFPTNRNLYFEWGLTLILFALTQAMRRNRRLYPLWGVAFALFAASFANALNLFLGNWLGLVFPNPGSRAELIAIDKLSQALVVVASLLLLTWLSGAPLGSIFLQKGKLRQSLQFGVISFGVFAPIFAVIAFLQSSAAPSQGMTASGINLDVIITALPWILIFVLANGFMEELWFRGISLGKLLPFLGPVLTILVSALVFSSTHIGATYISPLERIVFPLIVFGLGLINGFVMLKTKSIWGSVLFHAGYDLIVIIPILASLG